MPGQERISKLDSRKQCIPRCTAYFISLLVDVLLLVFLGLHLQLLEGEYIGKIPKRGFFRDDASISLPYMPGVEEVSAALAGVVSIIAPLILIAAVDVFVFVRHVYMDKCRFRRNPILLLGNTIQALLIFILGVLLTACITQYLKIFVGQLRPDFIARCQPNYSILSPNVVYISPELQDRVCQGDPGSINRGRRSFPSGHTSSIAFSVVFCMFYLERINGIVWSSTLKELVLAVLVMFSIAFSMTRIAEHVHHPSDIVAGFVIGGVIGLFIEYSVMRWKLVPLEDIFRKERF